MSKTESVDTSSEELPKKKSNPKEEPEEINSENEEEKLKKKKKKEETEDISETEEYQYNKKKPTKIIPEEMSESEKQEEEELKRRKEKEEIISESEELLSESESFEWENLKKALPFSENFQELMEPYIQKNMIFNIYDLIVDNCIEFYLLTNGDLSQYLNSIPSKLSQIKMKYSERIKNVYIRLLNEISFENQKFYDLIIIFKNIYELLNTKENISDHYLKIIDDYHKKIEKKLKQDQSQKKRKTQKFKLPKSIDPHSKWIIQVFPDEKIEKLLNFKDGNNHCQHVFKEDVLKNYLKYLKKEDRNHLCPKCS